MAFRNPQSVQLSAGVSVSEVDLTTVIPSTSTSVGAFAGPFSWGPVNEVITISDETRLADRFGTPTSSNYEYWFSAANFLAYSNALRIVRSANTTSTLNATANGAGILIENNTDYELNHSTANTQNGPFTAKWAGDIGNSLKISICPTAAAFASNLTSTTSVTCNATSAGATTINVTGVATANLVVGDLISYDGGTSYVRVANLTATSIGVGTAVGTGGIVVGTPILRKWEYADNFGIAPGTSDYTTSQNGLNDEMHVIVIDEDGKFTGSSNTVVEKWAFVSKASDAKSADGSSNYYKNVINDKSRYVWWTGHQPGGTNWGTSASGLTFTQVNSNFTASLSAGADGTIGNSDIISAYNKFENPDSVDVGLVVSGPGNQTTVTSLITMVENRGDCVLFISPTKANAVDNAGDEVTDIVAYRDNLASSSYVVMDSGWKYQYDKYNDVYRWVPLNGDIAGLCARTDLERDPWYSPGGFSRGQIRNSIKLSWNPTKTERDDLYIKGVNPVVTFPGEGTVLFGDKTMLSKPSAFDRINVRRLFIALEKTISRASRSSLFEFNDQFTRAQFVSIVEPYLRDVQGRRGITDFRVVCDETNNTAEVIDRNEFRGDIYIKPARSINFIQLNFVAVRTGVSFEEIVGRF
jgi:hypothetical protein